MKNNDTNRRGTGRITALLLLIVLTITAILLTGCKNDSEGNRASLTGGYLFTIDGSSFDFGEAKIIFMTYQRMNERVYGDILGDEFWKRQVSEDVTFDTYIKEYYVLPELVCVKALCMMAEEEEIGISDNVKPYIEAAANQYYYNLSPSEKEYLGVGYDTCYQTFADYYLAHTMMQYYSANVDREISDDAARVAVVKQIFVKDSVSASNAYYQLTEAYASFTSVYNEYDESGEGTGGTGTIQVAKGSGKYSLEYENAVFALKDGELSGIIETEEGYYIVQCIEAFNKELTEENKENIVNQLVYEAWYDDYAAFMEDKKTVLNQTAYDAIQFDSVRFEVIQKEQEKGSEDTSAEVGTDSSNGQESKKVIQTFDISFFDIYDQYISKHETEGLPEK